MALLSCWLTCYICSLSCREMYVAEMLVQLLSDLIETADDDRPLYPLCLYICTQIIISHLNRNWRRMLHSHPVALLSIFPIHHTNKPFLSVEYLHSCRFISFPSIALPRWKWECCAFIFLQKVKCRNYTNWSDRWKQGWCGGNAVGWKLKGIQFCSTWFLWREHLQMGLVQRRVRMNSSSKLFAVLAVAHCYRSECWTPTKHRTAMHLKWGF